MITVAELCVKRVVFEVFGGAFSNDKTYHPHNAWGSMSSGRAEAESSFFSL